LLIVMLITRVQNQWIIAMHRFTEVSIGIAVGLAISAFLAGVQSRRVNGCVTDDIGSSLITVS